MNYPLTYFPHLFFLGGGFSWKISFERKVKQMKNLVKKTFWKIIMKALTKAD